MNICLFLCRLFLTFLVQRRSLSLSLFLFSMRNFISSWGKWIFLLLHSPIAISFAGLLFFFLWILDIRCLLASYQFNFDRERNVMATCWVERKRGDEGESVECRWIKKIFFVLFSFPTLLSDSINEIFQLAFRKSCLKHWLLILFIPSTYSLASLFNY